MWLNWLESGADESLDSPRIHELIMSGALIFFNLISMVENVSMANGRKLGSFVIVTSKNQTGLVF